MNQQAISSRSCPSCRHQNPDAAKFCSRCAQSLTPSAPAGSVAGPQPQAASFGAPPMPAPSRGINFAQFGASRGSGVQIATDAETAMRYILTAVQTSRGGEIHYQSGLSANFAMEKKEWGSSAAKYNGELSITPTSGSACVVNVSLKLNWSSIVPTLVAVPICLFVAGMFNPMIMPFFMMLTLALAGYSAWSFGSKHPNNMIQQLLKELPRSQGMGPAGVTPPASMSAPAAPRPATSQPSVPQPATPLPSTPVVSQPTTPVTSVNKPLTAPLTVPLTAPMDGPVAEETGLDHADDDVAPEATDERDSTASVVERIKQLASLRDAGAITDDDYESRKAELIQLI